MKRTVKVKLNTENCHDFGCVVPCKCGRKVMFNKVDFEPAQFYHCKICNNLLLVICEEGVPYYAGNKVFP